MERFILVISTKEKLMDKAEDFSRMETATLVSGEMVQALARAVTTIQMVDGTKARCLTVALMVLGSSSVNLLSTWASSVRDNFLDLAKFVVLMAFMRVIFHKISGQALDGTSTAERVFSLKECGSLIRKTAEENKSTSSKTR